VGDKKVLAVALEKKKGISLQTDFSAYRPGLGYALHAVRPLRLCVAVTTGTICPTWRLHKEM